MTALHSIDQRDRDTYEGVFAKPTRAISTIPGPEWAG